MMLWRGRVARSGNSAAWAYWRTVPRAGAGNREQSLAGAMAAAYRLIELQTPGAVVQTNLSVRGAAWEGRGALHRQDGVGARNAGQAA
jgi:hypothetical protein